MQMMNTTSIKGTNVLLPVKGGSKLSAAHSQSTIKDSLYPNDLACLARHDRLTVDTYFIQLKRDKQVLTLYLGNYQEVVATAVAN